MPELPEVETIKLGLCRLLVGRTLRAESHDTPKGFPNSQSDVRQFLVGSRVIAVTRRAKVLFIELSSDYTLLVHLKMTGQLVFVSSQEVRFGAGHPSDSLVKVLPNKSTRVTLTFEDGSRLFFNDQRKFGWMRLLPTAEISSLDFFLKVGPEPLSADFSWQVLAGRLQRRKNTTIKAALLDQSVVAGLGNIYVDESLWGAKIHPARTVRNVSEHEIKALFAAIQTILRRAIAEGGSSDKNYVNAEGKKGSYLAFASVFRREGQPCPRCQAVIIKTRVAGRGTHTCPNCQSLKSPKE